jgi:3-methyladenine DNA glycosylase AlkC
LDFIKIENFSLKETNRRLSKQTKDLNKYLQIVHQLKDLYPEYIENSLNSKIKKKKNKQKPNFLVGKICDWTLHQARHADGRSTQRDPQYHHHHKNTK